MSNKRILIIQTDDVYFLHETLQVLKANSADLADYEITLLAAPKSKELLEKAGDPLLPGTTSDIGKVLSTDYEISFNLSLSEAAWQLQGSVKAKQKAGAYFEGNDLRVHGIWSAWFLTFKGNTPFVTFHMREIFRKILGIQKKNVEVESSHSARTIIVGMTSPEFFPKEEQEAFLSGLVRRFPGIQVMDESEVSPDHDHSASLYIGPASMNALLLCEAGARGIYFSSRFQGLNLLPEKEGTMLITTSGKKLDAQSLLGLLETVLKEKELKIPESYSLYRISMENVFGASLERLAGSELSYPFYQAHLVLWNYLLALQDINLEIAPPSKEQADLMGSQLEIVTKLLRLHDYAMVALDHVYKEAKSDSADGGSIQKHLETLREVDETFDKISASNPFLRPILDFYKIRKGQTEGESLLERSQNSLLTYNEEHQALSAFGELLTTIKNRK